MTRSITRILASTALFFAMGLVACDGDEETGPDENADETAEGSGDMDTGESGESGESGDTDPDCPPGSFDCPCDDGMCAMGLTCGPDGLCALGGSETGNPTTTGETATTNLPPPGNPYDPDPEACEAPAEILSVEQIDGEFCSLPCTPETQEEDCALGPDGTNPACAISTIGGEPNHCVLICVPGGGDEFCPMDSTCKPIPQQPNTGLCTFP